MDELTERDKLSLEAVTYLRGRSLQGTYVLVDEAQNLEPTTLKTILTRVGEGTKVVFTGDTSHIDAPYLSEHNNAVSVLIDAFEGEARFGPVRLSHCDHSEVASLAATRICTTTSAAPGPHSPGSQPHATRRDGHQAAPQ